MTQVDGSSQLFTVTEQYSFNKPAVTLTPSQSRVRKGEVVKLRIQVQNPLAVPLRGGAVCSIIIKLLDSRT